MQEKGKRIRVKTCGITNLEDALLCIEAGADALGFIFASFSPRYINPQECQRIVQSVPPFCERIGVFVDEEIPKLLEIVNLCGLSSIQLHGKEDKDYIVSLKQQCKLPIIKAFRLKNEEDFLRTQKEMQDLENYVQAFLLDSLFCDHASDAVCDSDKKEVVNENYFLSLQKLSCRPIILAGALKPNNIQNIIQSTKPFWIDLCSGLEESPGKKDPQKVQEFFSKLNFCY